MNARNSFKNRLMFCCWALAAATLLGAMPAAASKLFTFTYTFLNGDYYSGKGYINSTSAGFNNYVLNYTKTCPDENGKLGTYKITSVAASTVETQNNFIYVNSYYDKESNHTFIPVSKDKVVGTAGLASEHDYIVAANKPSFEFGLKSNTTISSRPAVRVFISAAVITKPSLLCLLLHIYLCQWRLLHWHPVCPLHL